LLFRRRQCVFIAFDLLYLNGKDLRPLPLIERKAALKKLLRRKRSRILYLDHIEGDGRLLFVVQRELDQIRSERDGLRFGSAGEVPECPPLPTLRIVTLVGPFFETVMFTRHSKKQCTDGVGHETDGVLEMWVLRYSPF